MLLRKTPLLLCCLVVGAAACSAQPARDPNSPGFVEATKLETGQMPPLDEGGNWIVGPEYPPAAETLPQPDAPEGKIYRFTMRSEDSKIYPGIARERRGFGRPDPDNPATLIVNTEPRAYTRRVEVFVPDQLDKTKPAPFIVGADGPKPLLFDTVRNLVAKERIPAMVAISIGNGGGDAQGSQRGLEYDTMSGQYAEFVETEVLPRVEEETGVTLTKDPDARCTMGCSSGAAAALSMAWYRPELYHRVLSFSGTFVNQQWPYNPETPGGAWGFHETLIPNSPRKPLRIWMHVADRDLLNPNVMRDDMHDWVLANERMAKVLAEKKYPFQFVYAVNATHCDLNVKKYLMPHAIEWVWRDYEAKE